MSPITQLVTTFDGTDLAAELAASASAFLPGATQSLQVAMISDAQFIPPQAGQFAPISEDGVDALMEWLRGDSLDWEAVERGDGWDD